MDNLVKALKCRQAYNKNWCMAECARCEFYQDEYINANDISDDSAIKLTREDVD